MPASLPSPEKKPWTQKHAFEPKDPKEPNICGDCGKPKDDEIHLGPGPRGKDVPPEHLKEIDRRNLAAEHEKKLRQGMSSTDAVDSIGNQQHVYRHESQGYDRSGARLPDKKTDEIIERAPKHVGPRGKHAPKDSFHG